MTEQSQPYDAILVVSFGGPDGPDEVIPFLENVLRGRNVPRDRLLTVAEHYKHFGGISPINGQNRSLVRALEQELKDHGLDLPVYWGNRNWHPLLADALREMRTDGVRRSLAYFTSAYNSYSGCRQYLENIETARQEIGTGAPRVEKLRAFYNHPGFIEPLVESLNDSLGQIAEEIRPGARIAFTAHSLPTAMAANCDYVAQLRETARLVAESVGVRFWSLVFQSRSAPPNQPWLEPDICDHLTSLKAAGDTNDVVVAPIGFVSDHMEVVYDLDVVARQLCEKLELNMIRAASVGTHPRFISMIRELVEERLTDTPVRLAMGNRAPDHDRCSVNCCPSGRPTPGQRA